MDLVQKKTSCYGFINGFMLLGQASLLVAVATVLVLYLSVAQSGAVGIAAGYYLASS